jgi:hypothetical protein
MYCRLKGVIQTTGLKMASAQAETLSLPHGDEGTILVSVSDDAGIVQDLGGVTLTFRILHPVGGQVLYRSTSTGAPGRKELAVVVEPPTSIPPGSYQWDLWFTVSGGTDSQCIPLGAFMILQSSR